MAGCLGEPNVSWDRGAQHLFAEEFLQVGGYLLGKVGAVVVHGEQNAFEPKLRVECLCDAVQRANQFGDSFEREVFGLQRDQQAVGGDQGIERQQVQGGGAIEQDEVVACTDGLDGVAQPELAAFGVDELQRGADEVFASRDERECRNFGWEGGFADRGGPEQDVVDGESLGFFRLLASEAEAASGVRLGVAVNEQDFAAHDGERRRQVDRGGRLSYPAFLVDDGEDFCGGIRGVCHFIQ